MKNKEYNFENFCEYDDLFKDSIEESLNEGFDTSTIPSVLGPGGGFPELVGMLNSPKRKALGLPDEKTLAEKYAEMAPIYALASILLSRGINVGTLAITPKVAGAGLIAQGINEVYEKAGGDKAKWYEYIIQAFKDHPVICSIIAAYLGIQLKDVISLVVGATKGIVSGGKWAYSKIKSLFDSKQEEKDCIENIKKIVDAVETGKIDKEDVKKITPEDIKESQLTVESLMESIKNRNPKQELEEGIKDGLKNTAKGLGRLVGRAAKGTTKGALKGSAKLTGHGLKGIAKGLGNVAKGAAKGLGKLAIDASKGIVKGVGDVAQGAIKGTGRGIGKAVGNLKTDITKGKGVGGKLKGALTGSLKGIGNITKGFLGGTLSGTGDGVVDIAKAATVGLSHLCTDVVDGTTDGITSTSSELAQGLGKLIKDIQSGATENMDDSIKQLKAGAKELADETGKCANEKAKQIADGTAKLCDALAEKLKTASKDAYKGIVKGVKGVVNAIRGDQRKFARLSESKGKTYRNLFLESFDKGYGLEQINEYIDYVRSVPVDNNTKDYEDNQQQESPNSRTRTIGNKEYTGVLTVKELIQILSKYKKDAHVYIDGRFNISTEF